MKKLRVTYDQAIAEYTAFYGQAPAINQINHCYHEYVKVWKHFNGFTDWLTYNQ